MDDRHAVAGDCTANRYTYVNGDPINHVDPSGHCSQRLIDIAVEHAGEDNAFTEIMRWCQQTLWDAGKPLDSDREVLAQGYDASVEVFGDRVADDPWFRVLLGVEECKGFSFGDCRLAPSFWDGIDWTQVTPETASLIARSQGYGLNFDSVFTYEYFAAANDGSAQGNDRVLATRQRQRIDSFRRGGFGYNRGCEAAGRYTTADGCRGVTLEETVQLLAHDAWNAFQAAAAIYSCATGAAALGSAGAGAGTYVGAHFGPHAAVGLGAAGGIGGAVGGCIWELYDPHVPGTGP